MNQPDFVVKCYNKQDLAQMYFPDITVRASVNKLRRWMRRCQPLMDDQMKKELDEMCEAMGMNISTFYMIYTKKALRDRRIPFDIEAPADPFYSEQNMAQLRKSAQQVKEGKIITKTMEDLEAIACE